VKRQNSEREQEERLRLAIKVGGLRYKASSMQLSNRERRRYLKAYQEARRALEA
jgi:hypothetical protein